MRTKYTFGYGLKVEKLGWRAESPRVSGTITEITQRNLLCIYPLLYSSQFYSSPSAVLVSTIHILHSGERKFTKKITYLPWYVLTSRQIESMTSSG
ncbi:Protein of unknown function [Cotesia congregata]|uniref:Uncharacterized protein n=1 Tax=Cotesia congregata TaxID=51543 RepID=A0A8J2HG76_COTCN|nr:Protein of unknown function [Cotesia congregata]